MDDFSSSVGGGVILKSIDLLGGSIRILYFLCAILVSYGNVQWDIPRKIIHPVCWGGTRVYYLGR